MTPHDRAVAWLDAHPEIVEAVTIASYLNPMSEAGDDGRKQRRKRTRRSLVAFLTTPLPCARCKGRGWMPTSTITADADGMAGRGTLTTTPCDCTDGTAGILLDQLEARYEQVADIAGPVFRKVTP